VNRSILEAKIREMEHAFQTAVSEGKDDEAHLWNRELLIYLVRLTDALRNSTPDK
jgi:hypothetical protein